MGNQTSSLSEELTYQKLQFVESLGPAKMLMKAPNSNEQFIVLQSTFPTQQQAQKYCESLNIRYDPGHQYYFAPIKKLVVNSSTFCSKQHKCVQVFAYEDYTFQQQINNRIQQKRHFTEREVWSVLCSCVLFMAHFTRLEIVHLPLSPNDILLDTEGKIKVKPAQLSDFHLDCIFHPGFYYAPQTLKSLRNRTVYNPTNKASVFSLGATILSALTLTQLNSAYSQNFNIDMSIINKCLAEVESSQMKQILSKMLKPAPYERISFTELEEMLYAILENSGLQPEEQQIQKLQQSIYRVKTVVQQNFLTAELCRDIEDFPNSNTAPNLYIDQEIIDEQENSNKINFNKNQERYDSALKQRQQNIIYQNINIKGKEMKKSNAFLETSTPTNRQGPVYVTQQYSRGRYQGYKEDGMRHGFGTFHYAQGGRYSGEWRKNKMEGRGALYYGNGQLAYEGEWKSDQLHGFGVLYNQNPVYLVSGVDWHRLDTVASSWVKYQGNFVQDRRNGEGTLFLSNGQYYRGQFKDDFPMGKGLFRTTSNKLIKGKWQKGVFESYQN